MADGMVLHPGHDEMHGVTVVVAGKSGRTYVGRWHERGDRGVVLRNVAVLEAGNEREPWLAKLRKFGVPPGESTVVVPESECGEVRRLVVG